MHRSRSLLALGVSIALLSYASFAFAQGGDTTAKTEEKSAEEPNSVRPSKVEKKLPANEVVIIDKIDGWSFGEAPKGSLAMLRTVGDTTAMLEVRFTPDIAEKQVDSHFTSFHSSLKQMGLKEVSSKKRKMSEVFPEGLETEYSLTSSGKPYRLVVWQVYRKGSIWFVTAFFPEKARPNHYPEFETFVQTITFK